MARIQHHGISDQSRASQRRREDAQALLLAGRWRGAMYLGGYAVECLLKASLMRRFGCLTLSELDEELKARGLLAATSSAYTHQFELLLLASGQRDRLRRDAKLWATFNVVNQWQPSWRYDPDSSNRKDAAEDFLEALDRILVWIRANF